MQSARAVLAFLAMVSLVGCASQADLESVRRDSDEMKSRLFAIDRSLGEVRGEVKEGVEKSLAGNRERLDSLQKEVEVYQKDMANIRKGGADLQATLDSARVDMQLLTGKVDDLRIQAQKPADDVALLKEDTGKRLALLEERLVKLEQGMARLEQGMAEQQKKAVEQQQTPEAQYQQGLEAMKSGDPAKAREFFTKFLDQHPKHKLAANAHYWLGETYYSEKNFEQAILEFQEVIKNFPEKDKVPAAMLKQGMAFKEMGDAKSSIYIYKKLAEEYPKSEEAKTAREKLRTKP
jgi:tol-pal system protein YbgF